MDAKRSEFTKSLAAFRAKTGSFSRGFIWNDKMLALGGHEHEWHHIYTYPFHEVFGDVARKDLAQLTGPGGGERNWQKLKYVWDGQAPQPRPGEGGEGSAHQRGPCPRDGAAFY